MSVFNHNSDDVLNKERILMALHMQEHCLIMFLRTENEMYLEYARVFEDNAKD